MKKITGILSLLFALVLVLVGCGNAGDSGDSGDSGDTAEEAEVVKVGVIGSDSVVWNHVKEKAAEEGIEIEIVYFDSYPLPNAALDAGEIDLNSFQHYIYLEREIEQFGYELEVIGETSYAPLAIFSNQLTDVTEVEDGAQIVIPDDVTNGGRALLLLQTAGLITVDPEAGLTPTIKDIENPRDFDIVELAAANIPASLEEAPLAVINSGIARDAGYSPTEDSLVLEEIEPGEKTYINIIVAQSDRADEEVLNRIVELYQSDDTKELIIEDSKGASIPVF